MAGSKKNTYIGAELEWAEAQLATWKKYIDDHPIEKLKHDQVGKTVISTQVQIKAITDLMKNYLTLLEVVDKLREQEEQKRERIRGDDDLSPLERGEL